MESAKQIGRRVFTLWDVLVSRVNARVIGAVPYTFVAKNGSKIQVHYRLGFPENSRRVQLPDGNFQTMKEGDIIHAYDKEGRLVERKRIKQNPSSLGVRTLPEFDQGLDLPFL